MNRIYCRLPAPALERPSSRALIKWCLTGLWTDNDAWPAGTIWFAVTITDGVDNNVVFELLKRLLEWFTMSSFGLVTILVV